MSERTDVDDRFHRTIEGSFQLETIPQVDSSKLELVEKAAIERAITERESVIQQIQIDTVELRSERNALQSQLSKLETEREQLRERVRELEVQRPTLEPNSVVSSLGSALEAAEEDLSGARYRISDIDVKLKANVINTDSGMRMHLPSLDEQSAAANLSEFSFRFRAPPREDHTGTDYVEIPDLVGVPYETAAQRLVSASLDVGTVETVVDPTAEPGTVLDQFPEPHAVTSPNSPIDLVIADDAEPDPGADERDVDERDVEEEPAVEEPDVEDVEEEPAVEEPDAEDVPEEEVLDVEEEPAVEEPDVEEEAAEEEASFEELRRAIEFPERDLEPVLLERLHRAGIDDVRTLLEAEPERVADRLGLPVEQLTPVLEDLTGRFDLEEIDGIGPTYAGRLREGGIEDIPTLARADPRRVAEITRASTSRTEGWIEQARSTLERR